MELLSIKNAKNFKGKIVRWSAPSSKENYSYQGISNICSIEENGKIVAEQIDGDDISHAFLDKTDQGTLLDENYCYSDSGRYISILDIIKV
ncbi:hypothetical protein [Sphingobacterium yanglingense]|uniref:Uncharacterized protein n=1 Tax=Sphingobacterium yanglingense TaxID=1437280 RepID=A0A4R6W4Y6_9SPHI|nr:hypothetical protein [Sphingobacterium yanglingense]TDQ73794.1 hypothetical protein CLV99_4231 [Sphingobacterium yanglingense]